MDKATKKKIWDEIDASTIPEEIKAVYLLADATETMSRQIFERIKAVWLRNGYEANENELLSGINDYCKAIKMASTLFLKHIDPQVNGATYEIGGTECYDNFNGWANELCRLNLLYLDRCAADKGVFAKTFTMLRRCPSGGLVNDEDISKYKMK